MARRTRKIFAAENYLAANGEARLHVWRIRDSFRDPVPRS
jgi:hypothetical protein